MNVYRSLLSTPHARGFVIAGFLGRMPIAMLGLGTVLLVAAVSGSYALAGAVSATTAISQAIVAPQLGRLVDRFGQRRVLIPSLAVHSGGLCALILCAQFGAPAWTYFLAAVPTGGAFPQLGSLVRARWTNLVGGTPAFNTALAFESVLDEVIFSLGPVIVTTLATLVAPAAGLVSALVFVIVGSLIFAAQRSSEPPLLGGQGKNGTALRTPGLRVVMVVFLGLGVIFGTIDVTIVALTAERGLPIAAGPLLAIFALGSLVAGLAYGARIWSAPLHRRFIFALLALSAGTVPLLFAENLLLLAVCAAVAGLSISPTLIAGNALVQALVPSANVTEGFTWASTALVAGVALGLPVAGAVVDAAGGNAGFIVCVVAGAASLAAGLLGRNYLLGEAADR